jgi:hypothetical protein
MVICALLTLSSWFPGVVSNVLIKVSCRFSSFRRDDSIFFNATYCNRINFYLYKFRYFVYENVTFYVLGEFDGFLVGVTTYR